MTDDHDDRRIVRAAIYPAIGVARVGDSDEHFIGPEVYPTPPRPEGFYRDAAGALKRQAARFRVYGYDSQGDVVRELTAADAEVNWSVHVANAKAAWYQWVIALDIPEAATTRCPRRNSTVEGEARRELTIDAGVVSIAGRGKRGERCQGTFQGTDVSLGELQTDEAGRLVFVPAAGVSASPDNTPIFDPENNPNPFINADGWYDDVADGPVTAEVSIDGRSIPCEPAWVLSAPPDYAPDVVAVRTLYDLLEDLFIGAGWLEPPRTISFTRDVYPVLRRLSNLGWVNKGFEVQYGLAGPYPFENPELVARLARPGHEGAELRRQILNSFRVPDDASPDQLPWPWVYGDAMEVPAGESPRQNSTISATQYRVLQLWAAGRFENDWEGSFAPATDLDGVPLAEQPETLTRAALEYCLADAFHPGCEVTWPVRHVTMWASPFRLRHRPPGTPEPDYGEVLTQEKALSTYGPLHAQGPGDLTRWMGLPWQADTAFCRSGYDRKYDPYVPTFWPATVPNQVITPEIYDRVMAAPTPEERFRAFSERFGWDDPLGLRSSTADQMERMVQIFGSMGCLEVRPGPEDDPYVPDRLMVATFGPDVEPEESGRPLRAAAARVAADTAEVGAATRAAARRVDPEEALRTHEAGDTGWASAEDAARAPLPVQVPKSHRRR